MTNVLIEAVPEMLDKADKVRDCDDDVDGLTERRLVPETVREGRALFVGVSDLVEDLDMRGVAEVHRDNKGDNDKRADLESDTERVPKKTVDVAQTVALVDCDIPPLSVAIILPHEETELLIDEVREGTTVRLEDVDNVLDTLIVEHAEVEPLLDIPLVIVTKSTETVGNELIEYG